MECGVHGPNGQLVVRHVDMVHATGNGSAIVQSPPTMAKSALVLHFRRKNVTSITVVQVH